MKRFSGWIEGFFVSVLILLLWVSPGLSQPPLPDNPLGPRTRPLFLPLPAFGSSPNKGNDFGILPVWLFFDPDGKINNILAPSAIFNDETGLKGAFRWIGFLPDSAKFRLIAVRSTNVDEDYVAELEAPYLFGERFAFFGEVRYFRDPTFQFFGLGPETRQTDETGFTQRELRASLSFGVNFLSAFRLTYDERARFVTIKGGGRTTEAFIAESFPGTPGVGEDILTSTRGFTLSFDTRDFIDLPTRGFFGKAAVEVSSEAWGSEESYTRFILEGRVFVPWPDDRWITSLRLTSSLVDNQSAPFFEQSSLGGEDFRAFPNDRFIDKGSILFNLEERYRVFRKSIFQVDTDIEVAPFIELGQVFEDSDEIATEHVRLAFGVGLRAVVRPNVVGKLDIGYGEEGTRVFVGLGYPF